MPELIDREATLQMLDKSIELFDENTLQDRMSKNGLLAARRIVSKQHTIDAEPVRHGQLIEGRYPNENKCSECGQEFRDDIGFIIQDDDGVFHYPKRCPECGCYWYGGADNG